MALILLFENIKYCKATSGDFLVVTRQSQQNIFLKIKLHCTLDIYLVNGTRDEARNLLLTKDEGERSGEGRRRLERGKTYFTDNVTVPEPKYSFNLVVRHRLLYTDDIAIELRALPGKCQSSLKSVIQSTHKQLKRTAPFPYKITSMCVN